MERTTTSALNTWSVTLLSSTIDTALVTSRTLSAWLTSQRESQDGSPTRQLLANSFGFCAVEFFIRARLNKGLCDLFGVVANKRKSLVQIGLEAAFHDIILRPSAE